MVQWLSLVGVPTQPDQKGERTMSILIEFEEEEEVLTLNDVKEHEMFKHKDGSLCWKDSPNSYIILSLASGIPCPSHRIQNYPANVGVGLIYGKPTKITIE